MLKASNGGNKENVTSEARQGERKRTGPTAGAEHHRALSPGPKGGGQRLQVCTSCFSHTNRH